MKTKQKTIPTLPSLIGTSAFAGSGLPVKDSLCGGLLFPKKRSNSQRNWVSPYLKVYLLLLISKEREIKCFTCGAYEGLEIHHKKYGPEHNVSYKDVSLLCSKCHRNTTHRLSNVRTVFENGKRFCEVSGHKFEY